MTTTMTADEVHARLEAMGTAQNRKVYGRHGVSGEMYGVSFADLGKLKRKIKTDQTLAEELWASGNHDARVLATMIADPAALESRQLDAWARDLDSYVLTDAFVKMAAQSPHARKKSETWQRSSSEWIGQAGWGLLSYLAGTDESLPDEYFEERLEVIEKEIHRRKNRVRHSMNGALISIGGRNHRLREKAVAAADRIGKVEVDHGETGCKTPEAVGYIEKIWVRKKERARKKTA